MMEWAVSIIIGFIVYEVISKWAKKKIEPWVNKYRGYLPAGLGRQEVAVAPVVPVVQEEAAVQQAQQVQQVQEKS
jgi:hypothetical protein